MTVATINPEIRDQIVDFLGRYFGDRHLLDDDNIFESGYVNSLFTMQLVTFVEKTFGVVVEDRDLDMENFKSIEAIGRFVSGKRAALAA